MQLTVWTYEGPPHVGVMRIATAMEDVHYVLHAPQGDTYADLLFTMIERRGKRPPVTYTTFQARDLGKDTAALLQTAARDAYARFSPGAMLVGASCTAELIQDDPAGLVAAMDLPCPVVALELPSYQRKENWGAAETFYQLVRTLAASPAPNRATARPTANILGPTALGFRHRDDVIEVRRILDALGIAVNVVAPLGATTADIARLADQAVELEQPGLDQREHRGDVRGRELGGDAHPRLAQERRREGEGQPIVEAGQHHLAALAEPCEGEVEDIGGPARVADRAIVAALVVGRVDHAVAGSDPTCRLDLPHRRRARPRCDRDPCDQLPQYAMPDNQIGRATDRDRVMRGGGEREQHAVAPERRVDRNRARTGQDHAPGCPSEQAARLAIAIRAGDEDIFADPRARLDAGIDDPPDRFISRHQRIAHAGKLGHPTAPQQPFGAGADPAPVDLDAQIGVAHRRERQRAERKPFRRFQYDRQCVHTSVAHRPVLHQIMIVICSRQIMLST